MSMLLSTRVRTGRLWTRLGGAMALLALAVGCGGNGAAPDASADARVDASAAMDGGVDAARGDVTVEPARIDDVLANPNMGFADFHFGWWCDLPPVTFSPDECAARARDNRPEGYPETAVAYFRWHWRDLEPRRGEIDFALVDAAIQSANLQDETLAFRVMTVDEGRAGIPDWLLAPPYAVAGTTYDGTFWPDYRDATFQAEHARFIGALGERYDDHPAVDHVDIGTVGCWGEWNAACLTGVDGIIEVYGPAGDAERDAIAEAYRQLVDHHLMAFPTTPVIMLGIGSGDRLTDVLVHATGAGAGWRVDCWGDWSWFSDSWSHQTDLYPAMIAAATAADPGFADVWTHAPIQLEVCGTVQGWHDRGYSADSPDGEVYRTFQWALDQHAAVLNAKRGPIPADYVPAMEELLRRNGYRYVIDRFNHHGTVEAGSDTTFVSTWQNLGVTPSYTRRTLAYRLRGADDTRVIESAADVRTWLPGRWDVIDTVPVPSDLPASDYFVDVAIVDRAGTAPDTRPLPPLHLGIEGRSADGWYPLSQLTVR